MKKSWNPKPLAIAALITASSAAYYYLNAHSEQAELDPARIVEQPTVLSELEEVGGEHHKVLPDVKLVERITQIGRRFLPH